MKALGMIEVYGYVTAVEALDSALKAANVKLVDVTLVQGGLVTVLVDGDVGAVKAAMDASKTAAERIGKVISVHVIARPNSEVDKIIKPFKSTIGEGKEEGFKETLQPETEEHEQEKCEHEICEHVNSKNQIEEEKSRHDDGELVNEVSEIEATHKEEDSKNIETITKEKETSIDLRTLTPEMMQTMTVDRLRKLAREIRITNMTSKEIRFSTKNELIRSISEFIEQER